MPSEIMLSPSVANRGAQPLADPDLYLHDLKIPDLDVEVDGSLRDAVTCFSFELYVPCLAMLTKATEGVWTELGFSLIAFGSSSSSLTQKVSDKCSDALTDPHSSVMAKVDAVVSMIQDHGAVFGAIGTAVGVRLGEVRRAREWTDVVRDSRNAVHYGAKPTTANTYEKVACLLLGVAGHFRNLYAMKREADSQTQKP